MTCSSCGNTLTGRQKSYCSPECSKKVAKNVYLGSVYNLTVEEWQQLFDYQGGVCAICKRAPQGRRKLVVDHEHDGGKSGKIRGLICSVPCNLRLVAKHKTPDMLQAAADYLRAPPAVELFGERIAPGRPKVKRRPRKRPRK